MGLRIKFNLIMSVALLGGLVVALLFANTLSGNLARRRTLAEAAVMMAGVEASIDYTDTQVSPLLLSAGGPQFLPQSIPFFAAQQVFQKLSAAIPGYTFRQPVTNPTNPSDRPSAWEAQVINTFVTHPETPSLVEEHDTADGKVLSYAKPVRVDNESCLVCHSTPEAAPPAMLDTYGRTNGFGWKLHSTVGAQIVSVPEAAATTEARRTLLLIMTGLCAVFLVMVTLVNLVLHFSIILPIGRVSRLADEVSLGGNVETELDDTGNDEIASLARSFNRMRRSLTAALRMLQP